MPLDAVLPLKSFPEDAFSIERRLHSLIEKYAISSIVPAIAGSEDARDEYDSIKSRRCRAIQSIDRIAAKELSVERFRKHYLIPNKPVIISDVGSSWLASKDFPGCFSSDEWQDVLVPVKRAVQGAAADVAGRAQEPDCMTVTMGEWLKTYRFDSRNYLKDFHIKETTDARGLPDYYCRPKWFCDDWLDECFASLGKGDYKFLYWGSENSTTPRHSDVLNSYSWSLNIVGEKEWTFYPPDSGRAITAKQGPNEVIFVPSTWQHSVRN